MTSLLQSFPPNSRPSPGSPSRTELHSEFQCPLPPLPPTSAVPQVGGHGEIRSTEDGSLILKPCVPVERAFYETVSSDPDLWMLRECIPTFLGTLNLLGSGSKDGGAIDLENIQSFSKAGTFLQEGMENSDVPKEEWIVLENIAHPFTRPNVLDLKIGRVLFDAEAPPEKAVRMTRRAEETTSGSDGVRIIGSRVWDSESNGFVEISREEGRAMRSDDLPRALAVHFPASTPHHAVPSSSTTTISSPLLVSATPASTSTATAPATATIPVDTLATSPSTSSTIATAAPLASAAPNPTCEHRHACGLPPSLLLPILEGIHTQVAEILEVLSEVSAQMISASLLIVYEADEARVRTGLEAIEKEEMAEADALQRVVEWNDDEDGGDVDGYYEAEGQGGGIQGGEDAESEPAKTTIYDARLIDFAHTRFPVGRKPMGEDDTEGVLFGLRQFLKLLKGRIKEVKRLEKEILQKGIGMKEGVLEK